MRRYISYLLLCAATLIGVGASVVPTILNMDADTAYEPGRTLYFRAADWDESSLNGNYTNDQGEFIHYIDGASKQPVEYIADTMRTRLDAFGLSGYKVETQGEDTLSVTVRAPHDSSSIYSYLENYLAFSGGDYELDASNVNGTDYAYNEAWADIIDGQTAYIVDMDQGTYKVPTVVVPLKEGEKYKTAFDNLVKYCSDNTTPADEEKNQAASNVNIVVWSNRLEGDTYDLSQSNANIRKKIVAEVTAANGVYYEDSDKDHEKPFLRLIPSSNATSGESYDASKTKEAYDAARTLMLTLNAGSFVYDDLKTSGSATAPKYAVTYIYSEKAPATVENLISLGDRFDTVAMSATFISILVCAVFLVVLLAVFERILAVLHLAITAIGTFSAFAVFCAFGAAFNVAALIGVAATSLICLFGSLYYSAKLKEELYKGRTLKKAHSEAVKRALWPTLDMSIISILIGLCVYGLAGDVASKAGVMLVLGGFFAFFANVLYTRIGGWLLCNDSTMANSFAKQLGVRTERIPDLAKEEKQSYFGPYADRDFSKGKKVSVIATCLFLLAGIGASIGWGIASNAKSFFNSSAYEEAAPVLRIDVRSNDVNTITNAGLSSIDAIRDDTFKEGQNPNDVLHYYKVDGKYLNDYVTDVELSTAPHSVYDGEGSSGVTYYWFYYEVTLGKNASSLNKALASLDSTIAVEKWNGAAYATDSDITSFALLSTDIINQFGGAGVLESTINGAYSSQVYVTFSSVTPADLTPYLWQVTLGLGVGLAAAMVYLCLRYRPSRGLVAGLSVAGASFIATSFFILTRIVSSPVVSLGSIPVAALGFGLFLFILAAEKDIYRDSKEKEKNTAEFRLECLKQATSRQAGNVLLFALLTFYVAIVFIAFGPRLYANAYIGMVLGLAFSLALALTALAPLSGVLGKQFAKITIRRPNTKKKKKSKQGGQLMKKRTSAEPEESIFIGIND